jgi:hypothetical protein
MTWRLILLMELQQGTNHSFIFSMSRWLFLRSRQVMLFQEQEKKLVWRKLCSLFSLPIGSCWSQNTSQKVRNTIKMTSSQIFSQSRNEKKEVEVEATTWDVLRTHRSLSKSCWRRNPRKIRSESPRKLSSFTLFSWSESTWLLALWRNKKEGSRISHSSRYSPAFDGDLEWPHFRRSPVCVLWVADPSKLGHGERWRVLFWIKQKRMEIHSINTHRESYRQNFLGTGYPITDHHLNPIEFRAGHVLYIDFREESISPPKNQPLREDRKYKQHISTWPR